ncbi:hypothetical protein RSOLAG22IIIB_12280 [Rhizoctonia solani]|uniref:Uncharacterized protein n=1 Tax=Rhizoctonia solani TaxID=456999 RepID=A0A0K6GDF4_9AGAM|nr:hypothetical protein RSOLAG22IIIB_12280 [Rhizoctonia solani]
MPKREKTPSPGPEEPKFLSIFYAWPPHVTLEREEESKKCARWISCFVGKDNLYAMFHKPTSPNTIIIEISNELTDEKMRQILGEHDWKTVFPRYDAEKEGITHSHVFYSTFRSRREVEKTGWKIRVVQDEWFKGFNPSKGIIVNYPYPPTTFCEPPGLAEEVNALQLFRYLPGDIFPEARRRLAVTETASAPPTAPPPRIVPGSGGKVGASSSNVSAAGGKGKKKGGADPNVRPTAQITRSAEAGAKAKATHSQPVKITAAVYDDDSEGDDGYGNYALHHQDEDENEDEEKPKDDKQGEGISDLTQGMQNAQVDDSAAGWEGYPTPQFDPFIRARQEEATSDTDICPTHKKKCKPGICQWAADKKAAEKRLQKRTGGRSGQNTRRW